MTGDPQRNNEVFDWKGVSILQREQVHKVGTDAVLLGCWVSTVISHAEHILDAGTGTGILALMAASHYPTAIIHAIDIDHESVELATINVGNAGLAENISVFNEDLADPAGHDDVKYDLVLSNPPYYNTGILPASESKARAKHSSVHESIWIYGIHIRLKENGHICIIVPGESAFHWIREANAAGYYNHTRLDIFSFPEDRSPRRSLLHFTPTLRKPVFGRLTIYATDNSYTTEYLQLTGIRSTNKTQG